MRGVTYRLQLAGLLGCAFAYTGAYLVCRGLVRLYWGGVALVCLAVHAVLGDDDVARP